MLKWQKENLLWKTLHLYSNDLHKCILDYYQMTLCILMRTDVKSNLSCRYTDESKCINSLYSTFPDLSMLPFIGISNDTKKIE